MKSRLSILGHTPGSVVVGMVGLAGREARQAGEH